MTRAFNTDLRLDLEDVSGNNAYHVYNNFSLGSLSIYALSSGFLSGTAGEFTRVAIHIIMHITANNHLGNGGGGGWGRQALVGSFRNISLTSSRSSDHSFKMGKKAYKVLPRLFQLAYQQKTLKKDSLM